MPDTQKLMNQFFVEIDGVAQSVAAEILGDLLEITIETSLHLPDVATLVMHDSRLKWLDDAKLEPGKSLVIKASTDSNELPIFDGEIVELEPDFHTGAQRFTLRAFDRLHRLSRGKYVRSFLNVTDGDIVTKIARELGLNADVGQTGQVHPYVLQANETNLEFLQNRAAALGYLLYVEQKKLCLKPVRSAGKQVELKWGESLMEFRPRMTTVDQVATHTVRGWDPKNKREIVGCAHKGSGAPQVGESRDGGELSKKAFGIDAQQLVADRPIREQSVADRLAQTLADRRANAFIQADGACKGDPRIVAGASIKIANAGDRFSGTYFVTSATHHYTPNKGYTTEFSISGQHPQSMFSVLTPDAHAQMGDRLVIGIVTDNNDPEKLGRVKVKYPWLSSDHASDWARVVSPGAGKQRGVEFTPEINDEVLVGFELGDVNYPYVLGGLWNGQDAPPGDPSTVISGSKVDQRVIKSRTGHTVILDDSDGNSGILIQDKNGNVIHLETSKDALTIKTKGNVTLEAQGNISIKSQANLTLEAGGQLEIKGATTSVEGSASVDVKGGVINLN
jgi:phage protein D